MANREQRNREYLKKNYPELFKEQRVLKRLHQKQTLRNLEYSGQKNTRLYARARILGTFTVAGFIQIISPVKKE